MIGMAGREVLFLESTRSPGGDDPLVKGGAADLRPLADEAPAAPMSVDGPPHLDPWVTWSRAHGVDRRVHGATVLERTPKREGAPPGTRIEAARRRRLRSISAYPPRPVPGFMVRAPSAERRDVSKYVEPVQI